MTNEEIVNASNSTLRNRLNELDREIFVHDREEDRVEEAGIHFELDRRMWHHIDTSPRGSK